MATGSNATPMGSLHPIFESRAKEFQRPSMNPQLQSHIEAAKRAAEIAASNLDVTKKKRKKRRWGDDSERTIIPGMPTSIPSNMTEKQTKIYIKTLEVEEIGRRLRTGDLGISPLPEERSPSPEPIYNHEGKRMNTREYRMKKKLEEQRHNLIQELQEINPEYKPPVDYKAPSSRMQDKVWIPQDDHPEINFIGLLIGPRGMTLKQVETETNTKIIIRGKGSVKAGKIGMKQGQPMPGEDEPLHALVTASSPEDLKKGMDKITELIKHGIEVPDSESDIKKEQLKQLALYNGTFREDDLLKRFTTPQPLNLTATIQCTICGGFGHPASDCKSLNQPPEETAGTSEASKDEAAINAVIGESAFDGGAIPAPPPPGPPGPPPGAVLPMPVDQAKMDSEYMSLMAELGEGPPPLPPSTARTVEEKPPRLMDLPPQQQAPLQQQQQWGSSSYQYQYQTAPGQPAIPGVQQYPGYQQDYSAQYPGGYQQYYSTYSQYPGYSGNTTWQGATAVASAHAQQAPPPLPPSAPPSQPPLPQPPPPGSS